MRGHWAARRDVRHHPLQENGPDDGNLLHLASRAGIGSRHCVPHQLSVRQKQGDVLTHSYTYQRGRTDTVVYAQQEIHDVCFHDVHDQCFHDTLARNHTYQP
jgi:hypothetical protein